ncbi:MAG: S1 RNA-binding domain-containing protein [Endomicrobium sp.]|nr:S1 RNA-binding domain-containing protein [Endomicrobium sp.]
MTENKNLNNRLIGFEDSEDLSMNDLMKDYGGDKSIYFGKEIEAVIIEENLDGFMVDLGIKSEGIIPKKEFGKSKIPSELKVGAKVKVKVLSTNGQPLVSYMKILEKSRWDAVFEAFKNNKRVYGKIIKSIKYGFIVDIGIKSFLHISQLDVNFIEKVEEFVGNSYEFIITEFDENKKHVVVSRRKIIETERNAARASALEHINEGQVIDGIISKITNFGAFVNLGGIDGLLHVNNIVWYKIKKVEDLLHCGQLIKVQVSKVDKINGKISLNIKNLIPNPWKCVNEKFPLGLIVKGTVKSVMDYGVFVELEPGIEGLLHVSEYSWSDNSKMTFKKGQSIEVKIIGVDAANKKIALSVKKMLINPWDKALRDYMPGTFVKGIVKNIVPFGAFIKLPSGIEGLIHINDFSWTTKIKHPEDILKRDEEIKVMVLGINPKDEKISLSLKHTKPDPYKKYSVGDVIKGKVLRIVDFGIFIELEPGIEALIKNNEKSFTKTYNEESQSVVKKDENIEAKIIKIDVKNRKIELSVKRLEFDREKTLVIKYVNQGNNPTLGEILTEE